MAARDTGKSSGHVFISYVRADADRVDRLQKILQESDIDVWRDTSDLTAGQDWKIAIRRAIADGMAFIACFSEHTEGRGSSGLFEELLVAVQEMRHHAPGRVWMLPARFADCALPQVDLGFGRTLDCLHRTDLFDGDWEPSAARLVAAVQAIRDGVTGTWPASPGEWFREMARLGLRAPVVELPADVEVSAATALRPRHVVVGYVGRRQLLSDLAAWRDAETASEPVRLWLVTGDGGFGKTRLAVQACVEAEASGWTAGLLPPHADDAMLRGLADCPGKLLIAIDYAETRPALLSRLIDQLAARPAEAPVRIMLLVRRRAARTELMVMLNETREERLGVLLAQAPLACLDEAACAVDRLELFRQAVTDFGRLRGAADATGSAAGPPTLLGSHFGRPLYVLTAAYLTRMSAGMDVDALSEAGLLRTLLAEHEADHWDRWDKRCQLGLDRADQRVAVALMTLLTATDQAEALTVGRLIPHLAAEPEPRVLAIAGWLARLYPGAGESGPIAFGPLEPAVLAVLGSRDHGELPGCPSKTHRDHENCPCMSDFRWRLFAW